MATDNSYKGVRQIENEEGKRTIVKSNTIDMHTTRRGTDMEIDKDRKTYKAMDIDNTEGEINRGTDIDRDNENGDKEIDKDMDIVKDATAPDTKTAGRTNTERRKTT